MPTKFVFLILPHTHIMDLAGPDQVLFEAIGFGADFSLEYCSYTQKLMSSAGLPFGKIKHYSRVELHAGDYLMVPGADVQFMLSDSELKAQKDLFAWIKGQYEQQVTVCSICTGAYILAMSGLLDGKSCTTHWKKTKPLQELFPRINVVENVLFTEQEGIFTSAGVASGIDMTLHIVEQLKGEYFAHQVARELVIYNRRSGNQSQHSIYFKYRNHIHAGIHAVQDWLETHLEQKKSIEELAEIACMSARNFTRVFKKETGLTVIEYTTLLRKERLKKLLQNADLSRAQLARACGLDSERQLSRLIRAL